MRKKGRDWDIKQNVETPLNVCTVLLTYVTGGKT